MLRICTLCTHPSSPRLVTNVIAGAAGAPALGPSSLFHTSSVCIKSGWCWCLITTPPCSFETVLYPTEAQSVYSRVPESNPACGNPMPLSLKRDLSRYEWYSIPFLVMLSKCFALRQGILLVMTITRQESGLLGRRIVFDPGMFCHVKK